MPHEHKIICETTRAEGLPLGAAQMFDDMSADNWSLSFAYAVADPISSGIRHYFIMRRPIESTAETVKPKTPPPPSPRKK